VTALMGGGPDDVPDRYALGSPASLSAHHVESARSLGDRAEYVPVPGPGHLEMISPSGRAFPELVDRLETVLG
jgi:hypothetical protein